MRPAALLARHGLARVDYVSIDTESSELAVLGALDRVGLGVRAVTVENNYRDPAVEALLATRGFRLLRWLDWDQVFVPTT